MFELIQKKLFQIYGIGRNVAPAEATVPAVVSPVAAEAPIVRAAAAAIVWTNVTVKTAGSSVAVGDARKST